MPRFGTIARRSFLIGSAAILGGVAFGTYAYRKPIPNPLKAGAITPYVLIDKTGISIVVPRAEMGQGVQTTLAALVAEELDADLAQVTILHGPASRAYYNAAVLEEGVPFAPTEQGWLAETARGAMHIPAKFLGLQITGGSSSTPDAFEKMRAAGAVARAALVQAAARRSGIEAGKLKTEAGAVLLPDGGKISYIDLATDAAASDLPDIPPLKPRSQWRILGKSQPRTDMLAKVTGTARFTADIRPEGTLFATARSNPNLGAPIKSYDDTEALGLPGVIAVIPLDGGFATVAQNTWIAFKAAELVKADWAPVPYKSSSAEMLEDLRASFTDDLQDSQMRNDGDVESELAADSWSAEYTVPYLAHATMEPMTAGAWLHDGRLQVWAGNQLPTQVLKEAATITGLPEVAIDVETPLMGGGFGRRAEMDFIKQAITVANALPGKPILLTWSREEDMTHDAYRPMAVARIRGAISAGKINALDLQLAAPSVVASQTGRLGLSVPGPDSTIVQGAWEQPYGFANYRTRGYRAAAGVPVSSWRSVGASQNAFFHESAVDELAHLAGADPLQFRMDQITDDPSRKVLEAVRQASGWGETLPSNRARGVAFCLSFGVPTAAVIEVAETDRGVLLAGAWIAADVGIVLDPSIVEAQLQGGLIFGLSAAIQGEITFADGKAQQTNFPDYEPLRLSQVPLIGVTILQNGPKIRGVGEPGTPPAAPALANAIFALTGERYRNLPLSNSITFA